MNYRKLSPGPELGAMVSEEVFGKPYEPHDLVRINDHRRYERTWLREGKNPMRPPGGTYAGQTPPRYSESLPLSWEVVKKMRELGYEFYLEWTSQEPDDPWVLFLRSYHDSRLWFTAQEETLPHSICVAALAAMAARASAEAGANGD